MSIVLVATIFPIPDHREEVIAAIEEAIASTHANDEGCELSSLHEGTDRLVMIEKWATPADADAHRYGDTVKKLGAAFEGKLAAPLDVHRLIPHPAGDPELGVI